MTDSPSLTAAEVAVLHDPDRWYEAFIAVSGDEARTPEGRRVIYARWRDELHGAAGSEAATRAKASGEGLRDERLRYTLTDVQEAYARGRASGEGRAQGETGLRTYCWACGHLSHGSGVRGSGCSECFCTQTEDIGGRPLAATPAPAGLDVERLISALNRLYLRSDKKWDAEPVRVFAEAIAAEYARLQPAPLTKEDQSPT